MDRYEKASLLDFVASIVWPTRTVRMVTTPGGETDIDVIGTWETATDVAMAWVNGNRVSGAITWLTASRIRLPSAAAFGAQVIIFITPGAGTGYLPRSGLSAMLGNLAMASHTIDGLGAAVNGDQAVRKDQVLSLIAQQLGGNYVSKAGDQMSGILTLAAAAVLTGASAAIRRDMAALILADASVDERTFLAKPMAPSTVDGDGGTVLATKDWILSKITSSTVVPNRFTVFNGAGPWSFTVPTDAVGGAVFAWLRGGGGGAGATSFTTVPTLPHGYGGNGGVCSVIVPAAPSDILSVVVGGGGGSGVAAYNATGGGGGGGASQFGAAVAGGGGGGGGTGESAHNQTGGNGGAAGVAGQTISFGTGGVAGYGSSASGGVGGTGGISRTADVAATSGFDGSYDRSTYETHGFSAPIDLIPTNAGLGGDRAYHAAQGDNGSSGYVIVGWKV